MWTGHFFGSTFTEYKLRSELPHQYRAYVRPYVEQPANSQIRPYYNIDTTGPIEISNTSVQPCCSSSLIGIYYSLLRPILIAILVYDQSAAATCQKHACRSNMTEFTVAQRVLPRSRFAPDWLCSEIHCLDDISPHFSCNSAPPTIDNTTEMDRDHQSMTILKP